MEFCKCGGLFVPTKKNGKTILICRSCSKSKSGIISSKDFKISTQSKKKAEEIVIVEKKHKFDVLPKTNVQCPKCENGEAFWWMQQTRAADEAPTRFYKCVKCGHTWREYE